MNKKALKFGAAGFLLGCFVYLLFAVIVSLRMNTGEFYFSLPALTDSFGNELSAVIIQIVTFSWLGTACGIAYLFIENAEWKPITQGTGYLVSLTVGMLPLAWAGQWYKHPFIGLFSYLIIIAAISLLFYLIELAKLKLDVWAIKRAIGIGREVKK